MEKKVFGMSKIIEIKWKETRDRKVEQKEVEIKSETMTEKHRNKEIHTKENIRLKYKEVNIKKESFSAEKFEKKTKGDGKFERYTARNTQTIAYRYT